MKDSLLSRSLLSRSLLATALCAAGFTFADDPAPEVAVEDEGTDSNAD